MRTSSALALVLAAVTTVREVNGGVHNCARSYTVVDGDDCDGISAKKRVSTYQLAAVNADKIDRRCDNLYPGERLCLGIRGQDCTVTHVVKPGQTCLEIAATVGTTINILLANNPNLDSDCTTLYSDEVLCTADYVIVGQ